MLVSIIVPNYNHVDFLVQRLESIFNQTYPDFEVILLDDASNDGSQEILEEFKNHSKVAHVVLNEVNSGKPSAQWQKGFELCGGELIWIAESDDWAEPSFLEKLVPLFQNHDDLVLAYSQSYDVDVSGRIIGSRKTYTDKIDTERWADEFVMDGRQFIQEYMIHANVIPNASAVVFKRNLTIHIDEKTAQVRRVADWITWCSILRFGKVAFIPEALNYFRFSPNNTRIHDSLASNRARIIEYVQALYAIKDVLSTETFNQKENKYLWEWVKAYSLTTLDRGYFEIAQYTSYNKSTVAITYLKKMYGWFIKKVIWKYITKRKSPNALNENKTDS